MAAKSASSGKSVLACFGLVVGLICAFTSAGSSQAQSPLRTWADTPARTAIIAFVERVTTPGSPAFVPPEERIATFGMDGTVIAEKPVNIEKLIAMAQVCVLGTNEPQRKDWPPFRQACAADHGHFPGLTGSQTLRDLLSGQTEAAYRKYVGSYLKLARHPELNRKVGDLVYAPMQELARYLQENGFRLFLVSGSTQPLVREIAARHFSLPGGHGIGAEWPLEFVAEPGPRSEPVFRWKPGSRNLPSVYGAGKALAILRQIGRPPIFAAGNTMGDLEMLQFATKRRGPGIGIVIVHDDAEREYAYSDQRFEAAAERNGWTLVSMKKDFRVVFAD